MNPDTLETSNRPYEECGVVGIWGAPDAAALVALGLHALQHRGQEAAGIVSHDSERFCQHKGLGLVGDVFSDARVMATLKGRGAIGHNRYATTGGTLLRNVQPLYADFEFGGLAVAHNGNLTNAATLRQALVKRGCLFQSTTDTEVFVHLIAISLYATVLERLVDAAKQVKGAYSVVALAPQFLVGLRDPLGVRPLILGRTTDGGWMLASETCALDIVGAEFVRNVEPGEMVIIDNDGVRSMRPFAQTSPRFCVFEYIYFARPDSILEDHSVYEARKQIGVELARESGVEADVIVPVPDSGVPSAMGFAAESGIPFEMGIIRNHYVGRTFIEPTDQIRNLGVRMKHSANTPCSRASAWCWSMIRSCAARPRARLSTWYALQARPRCICASAARLRSTHASTASILRKRASCLPLRTPWKKWPRPLASTASPSFPSTGSIVRSVMRGG